MRYDLAIAKFESLLKMEKAGFSIATMERYCNIRAKKYVADFLENKKLQKPLLENMNKVVRDLETLLGMSETAERLTLLGSAYKRKALLSSTKAQKLKALSDAAYYYWKADQSEASVYKAYAKTNWLQLETILVVAGHRKWEQAVRHNGVAYELPSLENAINLLQDINNSFSAYIPDTMDYWDMIAMANIKLSLELLMASGTKYQDRWSEVLDTYRETWVKAGSKGKRVAELEHLQLLMDGLNLGNKRNINTLAKHISELNEELSKII
jgi:hypothetical protein